MSKQELKQELLALLKADLDVAERNQRTTHEGATHEEARPENDKDTRALEQSYLAAGQARRVQELTADLALITSMPVPDVKGGKITSGLLVTIEDADGSTSELFIAPARGGTKLANGGVQVVTPASPLGRVLLGKAEGDDCELAGARGVRSMSIVSVR